MTADELMARLLAIGKPEAEVKLEKWIVEGRAVTGLLVAGVRIPLIRWKEER